METEKSEPSNVMKCRNKWGNLGYELINITSLCEFRLGHSGWCNAINEADDEFYHIQVLYRDEVIANITGFEIEVIDDDKYVIYPEKDEGFIIFRKVAKNDKREK